MSLWEWCNKEFQEVNGNEKKQRKSNNQYAGISEIDAAMQKIRTVFPEAHILEIWLGCNLLCLYLGYERDPYF